MSVKLEDLVGRGELHTITPVKFWQPTQLLRWNKSCGEKVLEQLWVESTGGREWRVVPETDGTEFDCVSR